MLPVDGNGSCVDDGGPGVVEFIEGWERRGGPFREGAVARLAPVLEDTGDIGFRCCWVADWRGIAETVGEGRATELDGEGADDEELVTEASFGGPFFPWMPFAFRPEELDATATFEAFSFSRSLASTAACT